MMNYSELFIMWFPPTLCEHVHSLDWRLEAVSRSDKMLCPPCDGLVTFHLPHLSLILVQGFVAGSSRKFASPSSRPSLQGAYSRLSWERLGEHLGPPTPLSSTPTCSSTCVAVTPSDRRDSLWLFWGVWLIVAQNTCLAQPALGGIWHTAGLIRLWP